MSWRAPPSLRRSACREDRFGHFRRSGRTSRPRATNFRRHIHETVRLHGLTRQRGAETPQYSELGRKRPSVIGVGSPVFSCQFPVGALATTHTAIQRWVESIRLRSDTSLWTRAKERTRKDRLPGVTLGKKWTQNEDAAFRPHVPGGAAQR